MRYLKPVDGPITGHWADKRPLADPKRPHGAIDIFAGVGAPIRAPASGTVFRFRLRRQDKSQAWTWPLRDGQFNALPWGRYGYDLYGGITVLVERAGLVHLFCHSYMRQLLEASRGCLWCDQEEPGETDWPVELRHTFAWPVEAARGEVIGRVGNQGESTAPHLHWEIHCGWEWTDYALRPDPEALLEDA